MLHEEVKPSKCSAGEEKSNGKELSDLARADLILKPSITSNMTTRLVEVQLMVWWRVALYCLFKLKVVANVVVDEDNVKERCFLLWCH